MHKNLQADIEEALLHSAPKAVYEHFIKQNNQLFLDPQFSLDRRAVNQRALIHRVLLREWYNKRLELSGYSGPASCIFIGGTGRGELNPFSDVDAAFLTKYREDGIKLKQELERSIEIFKLHDPFRETMGFNIHSAHYYFEDASDSFAIDAAQVNSLCDSFVIVDRHDYAKAFLSEVFSKRKVFSHLEHNVKSWNEIVNRSERGTDNLNAFDIKEDIGGLRHFQAALRIPTLGKAQPLTDLYPYLSESNPEVMQAYNFLLWLRGWHHMHRPSSQTKSLDTLTYDDFVLLGDEVGHSAQERLIDSRIIIENFADATITRALKKGYHHNGVTYGPLGIFADVSDERWNSFSIEEKNKTLAYFLRVSQEDPVKVDIDSFVSRFGDASKWAAPSKVYAPLFSLEGFGRTLFLLRKIRAYNNIIPGAIEFESSIPKGGHRIQYLTKTAFGRQKVMDFEKKSREMQSNVPEGRCDFAKLSKNLSPVQRGAIKLAFNTAGMPSFEGITPREYYFGRLKSSFERGISDSVLEEAVFLVENRKLLRETVLNDLNSECTVARVAKAIGSKERLYMLRAYTDIDLYRKPENLHIWPFIDEIYNSVAYYFDPKAKNQELEKRYPKEHLEAISGFGAPLKGSIYHPAALKLSQRILKVMQTQSPEAQLNFSQEGSDLFLVSPDFEGLLGIVSGKCFKSDVGIRQLHTYTSKEGIVFDVFNLGQLPQGLNNDSFRASLVEDINNRTFVSDNPRNALEGLDYSWDVQRHIESGLLRLSFDSPVKIGTVYALTRGLYLSVGANIYAARSWKEQDREIYRIFFRPNGYDFEQAKRNLDSFFKK